MAAAAAIAGHFTDIRTWKFNVDRVTRLSPLHSSCLSGCHSPKGIRFFLCRCRRKLNPGP